MRKMLAVCVAMAVVLLPLTGCGSSCDQLADVACEAAGADSDDCKKVQEKAAKAGSEDQRACSVALGLVESLEKVR